MADRAMQNARRARDVRNLRNRRIKIYRRHKDPFTELTEIEFKRRYRLSKNSARFVIDLIQDELTSQQVRRDCVSPELQILVALRFYAKSLYQADNGDLHGLSQPTVSRIIRRVSVKLAQKLPTFVNFQRNLDTQKRKFYDIAGFPGVIGCIDCTHIKIKNPDKERPLLYCNRKGWYSLNVQAVCDANCRILDINARWRGSAHDSRIWADSNLARRLEQGDLQGIVLGDSGYPCRNYLLTPLLNPQTRAERRYNSAHVSTRCSIERCFGQWKSMFRALSHGLVISLDTAKAAIAAMAVLYNIRKDLDGDLEDSSEEELSDDDSDPEELAAMQIEDVPGGNIRGPLFRSNFIQRHFN